MANSAWAESARQGVIMPLRASIAAASIKKLSSFSPFVLSCIAWSVAEISYFDAPLLHATAAASIRLITAYNEDALALTAWA